MATDSFVSKIQNLIESGGMARMSGDTFKSLIVSKIQSYSYQIPMMEEEISELFLNLTELMVTGNFAKISPDTFKVYLICAIYGTMLDRTEMNTKLHEFTGIKDPQKLKEALEELQNMNIIHSVDEPLVKKIKSNGIHSGFDFQTKPVLHKS